MDCSTEWAVALASELRDVSLETARSTAHPPAETDSAAQRSCVIAV